MRGVVARCVGLTEFSVAEGADERDESGKDPDDEGESNGAGVAQHADGRHEDAGADDDADDDGDAIEQPQLLLQFDLFVGVGSGAVAAAVLLQRLLFRGRCAPHGHDNTTGERRHGWSAGLRFRCFCFSKASPHHTPAAKYPRRVTLWC